MKNKYFLTLAFLCASFALLAQENTSSWKLGVSVAAEGDWSVADTAAWTDGVPHIGTKTVFKGSGDADCLVTDSGFFRQLVLGDNQDFLGKLIVKAGGHLTSAENTAWSAVGYNASCEMIIEAGGSVTTFHRFHVGLVPTAGGEARTALLEVAGTLTCGNKFTVNDPGLPEWTAEAYVTEGGVINTPWMYIGDGGLVDVTGGWIVMQGVRDSLYNAYATAGKLTAEGGAEPPTVTVHMGYDTVTVISSSTSPEYVGVNDRFASASKLGVYPNPATDVVYFTGADRADVKIYSITGQLVLTRENVSEISVETLSSGLYFVEANANGQKFVDKLLIK